jgi:hypothetical protein
MTEQRPDEHQAQFVYSREPRDFIEKLFMGKERRRHLAAGRDLRISLFPWGFHWIKGDDELSARWEDVEAFLQGVTKHLSPYGFHSFTDYVYTARLSNGRGCDFSGRLHAADARESERTSPRAVPGATTAITIEQLERIFTARVTRLQLPVAISRYRAGQSISFGVLSVSQAGIGFGDESVTWDEVEDVRTKGGVASVYKQGERGHWKGAPVFMVPNYSVFDALVHTVLSERSGVAR